MKRIAIVTGASSGMGREFALQIAGGGWRGEPLDEVWLVARRRDRLEEVSREILNMTERTSNAGKRAIAKQPLPVVLALDIASPEGLASLAEHLGGDTGGESTSGIEVALLVNNAGFGTYGPFIQTDVQKETDMVSVNCTAVTGVLGYVLPHMGRGGVVINTASLAAFMPLGNFAVYAATKAFVLSLSVGLAAEVKGRGIKVCALCPGSVSTEFALVASGGARREVKHGVPVRSVAAKCLKDAQKGKAISMPKLTWRITAFLSRFVSRSLVAWITYKFCPRPHGGK